MRDQGLMSAADVAAKLVRLEPVAELRYRDVPLEARTVDVRSSCPGAVGRLYRFFVVRPPAETASPHPADHARLPGWHSDVFIVPHLERKTAIAQLSEFECEFAVRTFLQRVEREIDAALGVQRGEARRSSG